MNIPERYLSKIEINKNTGCWIWTSAKIKGYGIYRLNNRNFRAHRMMYEFHYGPIPKDMLICHKCDNPSCVNINHLFLGTAQDNIIDMHNKGRFDNRKGDRHPLAKLTDKNIIDIRSSWLNKLYNQRQLARMYSVTFQTISDIVNRKSWVHI